jgi:tRNA (guanine37-N1)-methyltransferase
MRLYIGLVHYPVYNKNKDIIASAITNFDLHDLSRLAKTFGVKKFFVITPLEDQRELAGRILRHWTSGYGARYNRFRKEAIELIAITPSLDQGLEEIKAIEGEAPLLIATDASRKTEKRLSYSEAIEILDTERSVLLLFGTAWGLHEEIILKADFMLDPIGGEKDYNHLSVRTAAGIILDRLAGRYE